MDMLSILPDDVICGILSFLPTKSSVRTSILSKRWRSLWTLVPVLEFTCPYSERVDSKIIGKVMLQHKLNINTFRLDYQKLGLSDYELESWIDNVAARNVRNLVINLDYQTETKLPQCLFTCKTLVSLTLENSGNIPVGGGVDFPVLKKLELFDIVFDSDESLPRLLFGCPVLEELYLRTFDLRNMVVCSPTLTTLTIYNDYGLIRVDPYKMKLDAPALRYLRLSACTYQIFSGGTLASLNEADVDFFHCARGSDDESDEDDVLEKAVLCNRSVLEFLDKMRNVSCLKLSHGHLRVFDDTFSVLAPKFHNLTELELSGDYGSVPFFLENANSLRLLKGSFVGLWRDPKQVPACLISHLETVNLGKFWWSMEHHFDMIKYILRNGKVLKRVGITTRYHPREHGCMKFRLHDILASFERGSQTCQVYLD